MNNFRELFAQLVVVVEKTVVKKVEGKIVVGLKMQQHGECC